MKLIAAFIGILLCLALAGCGGSSSETNANLQTAEVVNANPTDNTNVTRIEPVNANGVNANAMTGPVPANAVTAPEMSKAKQLTYPAPDNSEFFTTMDKSGAAIETRVFKDHPQLVKVVRTWKSVNDKTIAIYLKNGKVVNLPGDKIENINSQPASVFVEAAGLKPPPAGPRVKQPVKKNEDTKSVIKQRPLGYNR